MPSPNCAASSSSDSEFGEPTWEYNENGATGGLDVALMGIGVAAVGWLGRRLSRRSVGTDVHEELELEYEELPSKVADEFQDARETWIHSGCCEDVQSYATMPIELNLDASSETESESDSEAAPSEAAPSEAAPSEASPSEAAPSESPSLESLPSPVSSPGAQICSRDIAVLPFEFETARETDIQCLKHAPWKSRREIGVSLTDILTGAALTSWCCCVGK